MQKSNDFPRFVPLTVTWNIQKGHKKWLLNFRRSVRVLWQQWSAPYVNSERIFWVKLGHTSRMIKLEKLYTFFILLFPEYFYKLSPTPSVKMPKITTVHWLWTNVLVQCWFELWTNCQLMEDWRNKKCIKIFFFKE